MGYGQVGVVLRPGGFSCSGGDAVEVGRAPGGEAGACWGRRRARGEPRGLLWGWSRSLPTHSPEHRVSISSPANTRPPVPAAGSGSPGRIQPNSRASSPRSSFDLQSAVLGLIPPLSRLWAGIPLSPTARSQPGAIPALSQHHHLPPHRSCTPQDRQGQLQPHGSCALAPWGAAGGSGAGGGSPKGIEQAAMFQEEPWPRSAFPCQLGFTWLPGESRLHAAGPRRVRDRRRAQPLS